MNNLRRLNLQKVIPGVFDDSLSHNETLARMLAKLNEQTGVINDLIEEIEGLEGGGSVVVEDVLTSDSIVNALSAKQGKVLKGMVDDKVDKVTGKGLSANDFTDTLKSKLDNVADNANNYTHPANHPPSIITQDVNNRFVTDTEKSTWNGKEDAGVAIPKTTNITSIDDTGVADGEIIVANLTAKKLETSNKTIVTTLGADDTTVPTSKAVKDALGTTGAVASVVISGNTEITMSAVDTTTDTFTSVAHGLANGDVIYPILNNDNEVNFSYAMWAGGLVKDTRYFVVNKTDDTFQVSITSGGGALDLTSAGNVAKWHFEKLNTTSIVIANLPARERYRMVINGKRLAGALASQLLVNELTTSDQSWIHTAQATSRSYAYLFFTRGDMGVWVDATIDFTNYLTLSYVGMISESTTSSATIDSMINSCGFSRESRAGNITKLTIADSAFANGTTVEVYNA